MKTAVKEEHHCCRVEGSTIGKLFHFFKWWAAFAGLIASTSVCPFCGTPGCPVGIGSATAMAGFFSLLIHHLKWPFVKLFSGLKNRDKSER